MSDAGRRYATITLLRGGLVSLALTLIAGLLAVIYTAPAGAALLEPLGIDLRSLRPLHTTFAAAWVGRGGLAVGHNYLWSGAGRLDAGDRLRLKVALICFAAAGLGALVTLPVGLTSGREYVGYHPALAIPILVGWLALAWCFFRHVWRGFWSRPIYVYMWAVGFVFFAFTFLEQYAWLLPGVFEDPIVDRRLQWKACGSLVGAYNLFVYGALFYVGEKLTGDRDCAHSTKAFALFFLGLLNSFTNYGHHTYHLPQSHLIHWLAFAISMTEMILLVDVLWTLAGKLRSPPAGPRRAAPALCAAAKWWAGAILFSAILLSVPPLNALVHGTYLVTGHAMGAMLGIDTMILLGGVVYLLEERMAPGERASLHSPSTRVLIVGLNVSVAALALWLHAAGIADGVARYQAAGGAVGFGYRPAWLAATMAPVFALTGFGVFACLGALLARWLPLAFRPAASDPGAVRAASK